MSLNNETDGQTILPTPVLGVVGLIQDADTAVRRAFRDAGDAVVLLGDAEDELGGSEYLKVMHGLIRGTPPSLDLVREAALQRVLVAGAAARLIRSAHDCAEGGFAVTLAECSFDTGLGADVDVPAVSSGAAAFGDIATLYGESAFPSCRVCEPREHLVTAGAVRGVLVGTIGRVGGNRIRVSVDGRQVLDESLADAERLWSSSLGTFFDLYAGNRVKPYTGRTMFDKFREECGVFGICGHPEASNLTYLGLYALQHRGQESAGIAASDGVQVRHSKAMGYVNEAFNADILGRLPGDRAVVGHVRYSTAGEQPGCQRPTHPHRQRPRTTRDLPQRQPRSMPASCAPTHSPGIDLSRRRPTRRWWSTSLRGRGRIQRRPR